MDGDFVCNDKCHQDFKNEMSAVCNMTDSQFYSWMGADEYPEESK